MSARTIPVDAYKIRNSLYLTVRVQFFPDVRGIALRILCSATYARAGHSGSERNHEGRHGSEFRRGQKQRDRGLLICALTCMSFLHAPLHFWFPEAN